MRRVGRAAIVIAVATLLSASACDRPDAPASSPAPADEAAPERPSPTSDSGDGNAGGDRIVFRERGPETGLDVIVRCGAMPTREILEVNGGGIALIDFDGDEDLDVFVAVGATLDDPNGGPGSRLFRNDGDLRFVDVTDAAGISVRGWATGVAAGDYDGDGFDDLYVARYGANTLLRNRGDGTFEDVSGEAGVADSRWATSTAFGDLDDDGDLDLFVVNYLDFDAANPPPRASFLGIPVMGGPRGLAPQADVVYENLGDGRFADRTDAWGFAPRTVGFGLNLVIIDLDGDGTREVIVGNDSNPNHVWRRTDVDADAEAMASFRDVGVATGLAANGDGSAQATMGYAVADVNDDARPDLFSTNFSSDTNTLHQSIGPDYHDDATRRSGLGIVSRPFLGWACWFADWDHDGDEDLLTFNGHVYPEATPTLMNSTWRQTPLLFARDGDRFARVASGADPDDAWLDTPRLDRAAAFGDLDGDGDVDAVVAELNGPVRVLESRAADLAPGRGFVIALRDRRPGTRNHRGLGAELTIRRNDVTRRRWLFTGGGFQSSSAPEVHVAAPEPGPVEVTVRWPDGSLQTITVADPGPRLVITRDE